jgi:GTP cyclohydrolase I
MVQEKNRSNTFAVLDRKEYQETDQASKKEKASLNGISDLYAATPGTLYISKKHSKTDFVLVKVISSSTYCIMHYVAIEGKVLQMELRYIVSIRSSSC